MSRMIKNTILLMAFLATPVIAQDAIGWRDIFELGHNEDPCDGKVKLLVESMNKDAKPIGLTREAVITTVRSRLRGARIYDADAVPYLYVNVNVAGKAFNISVRFNQRFFKPGVDGEPTSLDGYATGWDTAVAGTHGSDSGYILQSVGEKTDRFIDEYLRVNEEMCELLTK